ncbi:MAG: hypothetical protein HY610_04420, partial [Elusimicrobia bacterium]|nr:hypothetical protein [Elusimicrobiota bacterium]
LTPLFAKYVEYVAAVEDIQHHGLFEELSNLQAETWKSSFDSQNSFSSTIYAIVSDYTLAKKGIDFTLTPEDWKQYISREDQISFLNARIRAVSRQAGIEGLLVQEPDQKILSNVRNFNQLSYTRNEIFLRKITQRMQEKGKKVAIVVAGGYHTPGLETLFKANNMSYITVRPQLDLTDIKEGHHPLDSFIREPIPLERLFVPEKISINKILNLGSAPAEYGFAGSARAVQRGLFSGSSAISLSDKPLKERDMFLQGLENFTRLKEVEDADVQVVPAQGDLTHVRVDLTAPIEAVVAAPNSPESAELLQRPAAVLKRLGIESESDPVVRQGENILTGKPGHVVAFASSNSFSLKRLFSSIKRFLTSPKHTAETVAAKENRHEKTARLLRMEILSMALGETNGFVKAATGGSRWKAILFLAADPAVDLIKAAFVSLALPIAVSLYIGVTAHQSPLTAAAVGILTFAITFSKGSRFAQSGFGSVSDWQQIFALVRGGKVPEFVTGYATAEETWRRITTLEDARKVENFLYRLILHVGDISAPQIKNILEKLHTFSQYGEHGIAYKMGEGKILVRIYDPKAIGKSQFEVACYDGFGIYLTDNTTVILRTPDGTLEIEEQGEGSSVEFKVSSVGDESGQALPRNPSAAEDLQALAGGLEIDKDISEGYSDLFGVQRVNGRDLNVAEVISEFFEEFGSEFRNVLRRR